MFQLLSEAAAAGRLSIYPHVLIAMRLEGRGPKFIRANANNILYRLADLEEWAESHLIDPRGDKHRRYEERRWQRQTEQAAE